MAVIKYKWQLRKGGRKMVCPSCGQRRFVPYVAAADGCTLAEDERGQHVYGRCDREDNCGYHRYPNGVSDEGITPVERKSEQPLRFYPSAVSANVFTNLFEYAVDLIGIIRALTVWREYKIGKDGKRTVFWQIAKDGEVRAGKSIPYGTDGHRIKTDRMPASWLHKSKDWDGTHEGTELHQCYFGEHLLTKYPDARVLIVESEKTAALMSGVSGDKVVWLASGGSQGIKNEEKNKALEGRDVWLVPDNGQYWNWREVADAHGWHVVDYIEKYPTFEGCDILDLFEAGALGNIID